MNRTCAAKARRAGPETALSSVSGRSSTRWRTCANATDYDDAVLAELYERRETYADDVDLIRRLIARGGPLNVLECFCGTGRIALPLAQDGHCVTGIDIAAATFRMKVWRGAWSVQCNAAI